jgi:hypothetical protein
MRLVRSGLNSRADRENGIYYREKERLEIRLLLPQDFIV